MNRSWFRASRWLTVLAAGGLVLEGGCLPPNFYSDLAGNVITRRSRTLCRQSSPRSCHRCCRPEPQASGIRHEA